MTDFESRAVYEGYTGRGGADSQSTRTLRTVPAVGLSGANRKKKRGVCPTGGIVLAQDWGKCPLRRIDADS
jgi:hypothetical protein